MYLLDEATFIGGLLELGFFNDPLFISIFNSLSKLILSHGYSEGMTVDFNRREITFSLAREAPEGYLVLSSSL